MRASQFHLFTLKEAPAEAEIISHQLMMRTGMIRKHAGGIYSYLPIALRIIRKIEAIVREEMNAAGALEVTMPMVQPAELWDESGRWEKFGPELLRFKDRHGRDFLLQPTSEEVITDIVRNEIHSWRQLPKNFYQIQTKFRDERRPRFGIMRGREFTMKDAYSFDRSPEEAHISYQKMYTAYQNIFQRLGLNFRAVQADTGAIGGSLSHEFQVIADTGEDLIVYSTQSDFAANIELAPAPTLGTNRAAPSESLQKTATPNRSTCQDVADHLQLPLTQTVKSIVFYAEPVNEKSKGKLWLCLVRGDHHANEVKIGKLPPFQYGFRLATEAEIIEQFQCAPGYLGPVGISKEIGVIADSTVALMSNFICGANSKDFHYTGTNWQRDLPEPDYTADIRNIVEGDLAPDGSGPVAIQRGIEVGHVFYLGTRYSEALQAHILDENGKQSILEMGCYGIGITRIMGAAIEQNHDEKGIIWPKSMAPFAVVLCPIGWSKSEAVQHSTTELYHQLQALGIEVILDDRDLRPGAMFADWELIGVPVRVTIGERGLKEGKLEIQTRANGTVQETSISEAVSCIQRLLND